MRQARGVSKAFTKEDEDAGFTSPAPRQHRSARLTAYGARVMREQLAALSREHAARRAERLGELLDGAEIVTPAGGERAALGARVRFRLESGREREVTLVTPDEVGLVPSAVSIASPLARALIGARVGEIVEQGGQDDDTSDEAEEVEELTVLAVTWPT